MSILLDKLRQVKWTPVIVGALLVALTLASRICIAHYLANDEPNDGRLYAQIADDVLEQHVYSIETEAPFTPTLIRLPGYPLFIAAVYTGFGHNNNEAVRIIQAVFDTATCVIIALIAWNWIDDENRKRRAAFFAFLLAALCPFSAIYVATILTETLTIFFMAASALAATYAFQSGTAKKSLAWWMLSGLWAGAAVLLRPDSGLFAAGIGLTLCVSGLFLQKKKAKLITRFLQTFWRGAIFSVVFAVVLLPWTIRNEQVFHLFQPLAPAHAEMPGEFVPRGFNDWVGTWIDDERYIEPTLWNLEDKPITVEQLPSSAFDSEEERARVGALLDQYNHPPGNETQNKTFDDSGKDNAAGSNEDNDDKADSADNGNDDQSADSSDDEDTSDDDSEDNAPPVKMTPEIDAGFARIAQERINRAPFRYYIGLPFKRAVALWFDTHSMYYPFSGELFPTTKLDRNANQQIWLPVFIILVWIYTLLALAGAFVLWRARKYDMSSSLRWLLMAALITLPRLAFFATLENPEPRYTVELFAVTAILGGIAIAQVKFKGKSDEIRCPGNQNADRRR